MHFVALLVASFYNCIKRVETAAISDIVIQL